MADQKGDAANAQFKKLQRAADGKKAMSEYETEAAAVAAKTAPPPVVKKAGAKKTAKSKAKTAAAPLSEWLDQQKGSGRIS